MTDTPVTNVRARHILVDSLDQANQITESIKTGSDFGGRPRLEGIQVQEHFSRCKSL